MMTEPSEEERELLDCPFCGGAEIGLLRPCTETHAQHDWYIQCYGCNVETAEYSTRAEVLAAWNARALSRGGHTLVDADEAIAAIKEAVTTLSPRQEAKDAEKWMALAAAFGPILKEAFPDYSSIERMRVGEALADAVKIRVEWFRPKGGNVTTTRLAASSREGGEERNHGALLSWAGAASNPHQPYAFSKAELKQGIGWLADALEAALSSPAPMPETEVEQVTQADHNAADALIKIVYPATLRVNDRDVIAAVFTEHFARHRRAALGSAKDD